MKNIPFENLLTTQNDKFFGNINIVLNELTTFNECYKNLLVFLNSINISHPLPETLSWSYSKENPESFIYLNHYTLQMTRNSSWTITGEVLEHEPYHIPEHVITNYLRVEFTIPEEGQFEFEFIFFDGDTSQKKVAAHKSYYRFILPDAHQSLFESNINSRST